MYLLFDIGGTNMRLGVSRDGSNVDQTTTLSTTKGYVEGIELVKKGFKELTAGEKWGEKITAVSGGIAGPISKDRNFLSASPNLSGWVGKPLVADLEGAFGVPVYLENDAALAGLGEACVGAGYGFDIVAYITVSTGVGGARIVSGKLDEKTIGFEPGHQIIDVDRSVDPQAKSNMFEDLVSGTAVTAQTGKKPKEVTDSKYWDEKARLLAYGLNNTIVYWSPDVIVLGGSMIIGDPAIPIDKTEEYLRELVTITEVPKLKMAELGDLGGIHGALEYVKAIHR